MACAVLHNIARDLNEEELEFEEGIQQLMQASEEVNDNFNLENPNNNFNQNNNLVRIAIIDYFER